MIYSESMQLVGDAKIQQLINQSWMRQMPLLQCPEGHRIKFACTYSKCNHPSLHCEESTCQSCNNVHSLCSVIPLEGFHKFMKQNIQKQKDIFMIACHVEEQMMSSIRASQQKLAQCIGTAHLPEHISLPLRRIFQEKEYGGLKGKDLDSLRENMINHKAKNREEEIKAFCEEYQTTFQKKLAEKEAVLLNQKIFKKKDHIGSGLITADHQRFIITSIEENGKKIKNLELIYRGSEHGFKGTKFHQLCDGVGPTLTLLRTEFSKTLAAYTSLSWKSESQMSYSTDHSKSSFILQLDLKEKLPLVQPENAIFNHPFMGPIFGAGADLCICDECDKRPCSINLPFSYSSGDKFSRGQQTWTAFCGAQSGSKFTLKEIEVFKVYLE